MKGNLTIKSEDFRNDTTPQLPLLQLPHKNAKIN